MSETDTTLTLTAAESAFQGRTDLQPYTDNARLLFALQLRFDIDDVTSVAESSIVDGSDDKGCDLVFVDKSRGTIIVAQGYESLKPRGAAKPSKSDTLAPAATWLFSRDINELSDRLVTVAYEVREAIGSGEIECLEFWYVHNLPESENVRQSMKTVETTVRALVTDKFGEANCPERIVATEVGVQTQADWYEALSVNILVNDKIDIDLPGAFPIDGEGWDAVVTAVKASWLHEMYKKHRESLFSANYREYLGLRKKRKKNTINEGIQRTVENDPQKLWVYNNGVSALVNDHKLGDDNKSITIEGISIVNGAQTTGAIGSLGSTPSNDALVPIRFIRCADTDTISAIVKFNNSQNPLVAADFKSNDAVQRRLRDEFANIPECEYVGGRRGVGRVHNAGNLISNATCAQALASFHRRPDVAYHQKSKIFRDDELYANFFCVHTKANHVLLAYTLLKAVDQYKKQLREIGDDRTEQQEKQYAVLQKRGAPHLFIAAISGSLETILDKKMANLFAFSFKEGVTPSKGIQHWTKVVKSLAPLSPHLSIGVDSGVRDKKSNRQAIEAFVNQVAALTAISGLDAYKEFQDVVVEA